MTAHAAQHDVTRDWLSAAVAEACRVIAPSWPLDRQIAVNPWWGLIDRPFRSVAAELQQLLGMRMSWTLAEYRRVFQAGGMSTLALYQAHAEWHAQLTLDDVLLALSQPADQGADSTADAKGLPLLSDSLDLDGVARGDALWRELITQQISQFCASYFDEVQADWQRGQHRGLWVTWRESLLNDPAVTAHSQHTGLQQRWACLPETAEQVFAWAVQRLDLSAAQTPALLRLCLLRINGWASWCAYLQWQAQLRSATHADATDAATGSLLQELLAIRLAWEVLLLDTPAAHPAWSRWQQRWQQALASQSTEPELLTIVQRAHEISYQHSLIQVFNQRCQQRPRIDHQRPAAPAAAGTRLVFCIDVRSERLRRALEQLDASLHTSGFAGFFGLPIAYAPAGTRHAQPMLPGLVAPVLTVSDSTGDAARDQQLAEYRYHALTRAHAQRPFQRSASGAFALVESLGLGCAWSLLRRQLGWTPAHQQAVDQQGIERPDALKPAWPAHLSGQINTAAMLAGILRGMGIAQQLPALLVLVGHGSDSANNPQAAALECGACGGHAGDVNARLLASLLNDPALRAAIRTQGIDLPESLWVMAGLHHTTTDEVTLFDVAQVPASHHAAVAALQRQLRSAGDRVRAERAPDLQLAALREQPARLLQVLQRRGRDWAQTRPEWGLANNAAFVIAPRTRTRGMDLDGRCFLHDYHWSEDPQGTMLEQIMTAPMVVTHWINLQYFASTVEPLRYGSGNKVLHNVVGNGLGLFEGNSGDLRIGLSRQSVHDGQRWMHTPLRLSVFIDAPRMLIDEVLARHATVRHLVLNQWLYLFRFAEWGIEQYQQGWHLWDRFTVEKP